MHPAGFPVVLKLAGRPCLVVGGGRVATEKVKSLLAAGARVTVVATELDSALRDLDVTVIERPYRSDDLDGQWIVFATTGVRVVDGAVFADGTARGILVNSADDPEHCAFTMPAIARRGPITVAIATDGASPAIASWLRDRTAATLPDQLEGVVERVVHARQEIRGAGIGSEGLPWQTLIVDLLDALDRNEDAADDVVGQFVDRAIARPVESPGDTGGTVVG